MARSRRSGTSKPAGGNAQQQKPDDQSADSKSQDETQQSSTDDAQQQKPSDEERVTGDVPPKEGAPAPEPEPAPVAFEETGVTQQELAEFAQAIYIHTCCMTPRGFDASLAHRRAYEFAKTWFIEEYKAAQADQAE